MLAVNTPETVRTRCESIYRAAQLNFSPYKHEPVLDYETAAIVREKFGLIGKETKSLFIKCKSGLYLMFITTEGEKLDKKRAQDVVEEKISIATGEELQNETGCLPGCAVPIGLPVHIPLLVDPILETATSLIFSPGPPTETLEATATEWPLLLAAAENKIYIY